MIWLAIKIAAVIIVALVVFWMIYISVRYPHDEDRPQPWENQ